MLVTRNRDDLVSRHPRQLNSIHSNSGSGTPDKEGQAFLCRLFVLPESRQVVTSVQRLESGVRTDTCRSSSFFIVDVVRDAPHGSGFGRNVFGESAIDGFLATVEDFATVHETGDTLSLSETGRGAI